MLELSKLLKENGDLVMSYGRAGFFSLAGRQVKMNTANMICLNQMNVGACCRYKWSFCCHTLAVRYHPDFSGSLVVVILHCGGELL